MTLLAYALLIGLAAYRLYRIIAEDSITEPIRDWLYDTEIHTTVNPPSGGPGVEVFTVRRGRQFLADLFSCPWCIGWWYAGALTVALFTAQGRSVTGENVVEFVLLWCVASTVCGAAAKAIDR